MKKATTGGRGLQRTLEQLACSAIGIARTRADHFFASFAKTILESIPTRANAIGAGINFNGVGAGGEASGFKSAGVFYGCVCGRRTTSDGDGYARSHIGGALR